ncbi:MAG: UDP-N-acetylmuramoyl-tripeptide--D-alanyl-D-alanine ligase [Bifidobacteriaceae bacterium]|jgi:UDP-N-acetylmuramoyl-tripeptide--D-alanyl-D-alanine ligase|nr:UDP-N-acetylmuramoyl-tripeptide--D-alanyl-D-alanine ligase [Bifidobacteriaceae bacterium]
MDMTARDVATWTGGVLAGAPNGLRVTSCTLDSRTASPGALFVAVVGDRVDGHDFATAAARAGARLALVERPVPGPHVLVADTAGALGDLARAHLAALRSDGRRHRAPSVRVVAVTGSVGKTTTKDLLARVCGVLGPTTAAKGSYNNQFGLPLTILAATPETEFLVVELGANHAGEIAALAAIATPDIGIVLGVAPAHLGEFGSIEAIAAAKGELPAGLGPDATAVLNGDDLWVAAMPTPAKRLIFGTSPDAGVRARAVVTDARGHVSVDIDTPKGPLHLATALVGAHHGINVVAAAAGGIALGATPEQIGDALNGAGADSRHRMALIDLPGGVRLLDDAYNANPASSAAALAALTETAVATGAQSWAVLGEMLELGSHSVEAHLALGRLAATLGVTRLIAVGEGARPIATGALAAGMGPQAVEFWDPAPGPQEIMEAVEAEATNTVILIKGSLRVGLWRLADALAEAASTGGEA